VNRRTLWIALVLLSGTYFSGCGSSSQVTVTISTPPPATLAQNATAQIIATVTGTGEGVNWSCTPVGTCGSFAPASTASGVATTYTAPGTVGPVVITATSAKKASVTASANVTIQANDGIAGNFAFYVSGLDFGLDTYSLAGAVNIAADGTLTGEQDWNNGFDEASPAGGDTITSGNLMIDASGSGTLTLVTNNPNVGNAGTETFTVNFVNNNHALIIESDGNNTQAQSATSSGSLDRQTLPSTLASNFSFALTGVGSGGFIVTTGGVFTLTGGTAIAGTVDVNDATLPAGTNPSLNNSFTGTLLPADTLGRGTITTNNAELGNTLSYYVIGPEAIRLVVTAPGVDFSTTTAPTAVGSAFGQGSSTFSNTSIGNSTFLDQSNAGGNLFAAVGQIVPNGMTPGAFTGVADDNESVGFSGMFADAAIIGGSYTIMPNGYGSLTITPGDLVSVSLLGIYLVDPAINVNDPNGSSAGATSSALVVDLDTTLAGVGVLVPQTATTGFTGNYALGFQDLIPTTGFSGEVDFVGNAVAGTNLAGTGTLSDPKQLFGLDTVDTASFSAPITPDATNAGRYEISPFAVTVTGSTGSITIPEIANAYEASGTQLFWIEDGADGQASVFGGQIQATSTLGAAAAKRTQKP
jgi:hypothetical protein